jgi:cytochrome P450 family 71 subfamily A
VDYKGRDFEIIPFGVGRRVYPGISFAMTIVELAIANLLLKFDWSMSDGSEAEEINIDEVFEVTLSKKTKLCVIATPRFP